MVNSKGSALLSLLRNSLYCSVLFCGSVICENEVNCPELRRVFWFKSVHHSSDLTDELPIVVGLNLDERDVADGFERALGMLCTNAFELCFPSPRSQSQGAGGGFRAMTPAQTRIHAVDKGRRAPFRSPHARCTRTLPIASSLCLAIHRLPSANSVTICSVFFFRPR